MSNSSFNLIESIKIEINDEINRKKFKEDGYLILESSLNDDQCKNLMQIIDLKSSVADEIEEHYEGTEIRIWNLEDFSKVASFFKKLSNIICETLDYNLTVNTILGMRNTPLKNSKSIEGRWHIDSLRDQIKVFCFLQDVKEENGALAIIPRTNTINFRILGVLSYNYLKLKDLFSKNKERNYTSLDESFVKRVLDRYDYKAVPLELSKGSIVICNTSMIHRSSPCLAGSRYSITSYLL